MGTIPNFAVHPLSNFATKSGLVDFSHIVTLLARIHLSQVVYDIQHPTSFTALDTIDVETFFYIFIHGMFFLFFTTFFYLKTLEKWHTHIIKHITMTFSVVMQEG